MAVLAASLTSSLAGIFLNGIPLALCLGISIFGCSSSLQILRSGYKSEVCTTNKRLCRVIGFMTSPLLGAAPAPILALITFILMIAVSKKHIEKTELQIEPLTGIETGMLFHQLHYFTYAYCVPLFLLTSGFSEWVAASLFVGTWITYICAKPLYKLLRIRSVKHGFFAGHAILALTLLGMAYVWDISVLAIIVLWICTGFGGGTVYCITAIDEQLGREGPGQMVLAENFGHLGGVLIAAFLSMVSNTLQIQVVAAVVFVLLSMVTILLSLSNNTRREFA